MSKKNYTYESAFERLEEILALMNSDEISLDESIKLFQEADTLIAFCGGKLKDAETKIETLIKDKEGSLVLSESQEPETEDFHE